MIQINIFNHILSFDFLIQLILKLKPTIPLLHYLLLFPHLSGLQIASRHLPIQIR